MTDGLPTGSTGGGAFGGSLDGALDDAAFFRTVVGSTSDGLFTVDESTTIVFANPAMEDVLGYAPSDLVGRSLRSIVSEQFPSYRTALELLLEGESEVDLETVEILAVHADGHECWVTVSLSAHRHGDRRLVTGTVRDVSERKEREEELERYERIIETIDDGIYILDANFTITNVNEAVVEMTGYSREELLGSHASILATDDLLEAAAEASAKLLRSPQEAATLSGEIRTKAGDPVPIETRFALYPFDDESFGQVGVVRDITERKQFEETLTALHDSTRALLGVETKSEVCQSIVDTATDVVDLSAAAVYLFDADRNLLRPAAVSDGLAESEDDLPTVGPNENAIWRAFVEDERIVAGDEPGHPDDPVFPIDRVAHVPMGDHGVFVSATDDREGVDDDTWTLIGLLAASAEAALSRIGREIEIRERDEELERQNRRLRRLGRINAIIRGIDRALVQADTTEEIVNAVCDRLATADQVAFAWIGDVDPSTGSLEARAWAGDERGYLDDVAVTDATPEAAPDDSREPAARTADYREPTVVSNVATEFRSAPWRKEALSRDYRSVMSVPLMHGDLMYGVLTVYATRPVMFDDTTQAVFGELGETIANAMNAVETRRALLTDDRVELEFTLSPSDDGLLRLATEAGCRISYDEFVPNDGDSIRTFFTADTTDPSRITDVEDRLLSVESIRIIEEREASCLFEAVIDRRTVASTFADHGAAVRSVTVDDGEMRIVVELPQDTDVRGFVDTIHDRYPTAELLVRRDLERSKQSSRDFWATLENDLTDRQLEVLRVAYHSGFFEWPRETTGQEIADSIGVSQPTVNRHLRASHRKVFTTLFGRR